jgi:hypothetical protein
MSGHCRINREEEHCSQCDHGTERSAHGERQGDEQQSVQHPHGCARAALHGIGIILKEDVLFRKEAFVRFVVKLAQSAEAEPSE